MRMQILIKWSIDVYAQPVVVDGTGDKAGGVGVSGGGGPPENNGAVDLIYIIATNTPINNETNCDVLMPLLFLLHQD